MQAVKSVKVKGERQRGRLAKREIAKKTAQQQWLEGMHLKSVFYGFSASGWWETFKSLPLPSPIPLSA